MDTEQLRSLYLDLHLSQREMAVRLGCSQTTIAYWLAKCRLLRNKKHTYTETEEKPCPHCQQVLPVSEFYKRKGALPGSWCKTCMAGQAVVRQRHYKALAVVYKGGACVVCGFCLYQGALEFHHLDPSQKEVTINKFTRMPLSVAGKAELDKCVLVCACCHRMTHAGLAAFDDKGILVRNPYKELM